MYTDLTSPSPPTLSEGAMGRGYIVEDAVEGYLSKLCDQQASTVTGLLIGQVNSHLYSFILCVTMKEHLSHTVVITTVGNCHFPVTLENKL